MYAYDVNNRVKSSFSDRISYDANGNLLQANNRNLNVNYTYNGYSTRFLTEDPYWNVSNMLYGKFTSAVERRVYYPAVVQSGNRYAYCGGNPVAYTDSIGLDKDLDDYINNNYSGKMTLTIAISCPVQNSREVAAITSKGTLDNGHSFLRLDDGKGNVAYKGLAPQEKSLTDMLFANTIQWKVIDDSESDWNVAQVYELDVEQYIDAFMFLARTSVFTPEYNIQDYNCTTYAIEGLQHAGIETDSIGLSEHNWTLPTNLSEQLDEYSARGIIPSWTAAFVINCTMGNFYGYTPADAAQDLKQSEGLKLLKYDSNGIQELKVEK